MGEPFGPYIKTLMLTGQRRSEVSGMRRSEIDGSTWTIPGDRTKNKQTHTVPLSEKVVALDHRRRRRARSGLHDERQDARVRPLEGEASDRREDDDDARQHNRMAAPRPEANHGHHHVRDRRRTPCRGGAAEPQVGSQSGVAGVYNRARYSEQKRIALERWAAHVKAAVSGAKIENVVPMRA